MGASRGRGSLVIVGGASAVSAAPLPYFRRWGALRWRSTRRGCATPNALRCVALHGTNRYKRLKLELAADYLEKQWRLRGGENARGLPEECPGELQASRMMRGSRDAILAQTTSDGAAAAAVRAQTARERANRVCARPLLPQHTHTRTHARTHHTPHPVSS